jgi:hypothetical protein
LDPYLTRYTKASLKLKPKSRFQDGSSREEAESVPLKVKYWRDAGDTPYRKTHQEEAKL